MSFSIDVITSLGNIQLEILHNLTVDYMTVKEIANKRKTTLNAVKNIIYKLRKKNLIDKINRPIIGIKTYNKKGGGSSTLPPKNKRGIYRLHSEHHTIKLLGTSSRYFKKLKLGTQFEIDKNTIMIYRRKIVIYSNTSFYDDEPNECFSKAIIYWYNFFLSLELNLGIKIYDKLNPFNVEIKRFKCHIAKTNDPLSKIVINNKLKYKFIDDLGRGRLEIDNSKGLYEFEAVCSETCQDDINIIKDYQGDTITKPHYMPSEVKNKIDILKEWGENYKFAIETQTKQHSEVLLMLKTLTIEVSKLKNE